MSTPATSDESDEHRDRSIRLSVLTSLLSKFGTIILRLVSIPIAIRVLGMEQFGVYTAVTLFVAMIDILHVGIGPTLTRELSKAIAQGKRHREQTVFATGVLLSTGLTVIGVAIAASLLIFLPVTTIFGEEYRGVADTMITALWVGLAISALDIFTTPFEMSRDGYMETRFTNSWGAAGNLLAAITLVSGIWFFPTIEFLLISVNGITVLAKMGNSIHLLIQRPYLIPRFSLFKKKLVKPLVVDSGLFSITYILSAIIEYHLMVFLIGRFAGPQAVAVYNVMITIHLSLNGVMSMFTKPYWPALMDAFERKDRPWILNSSKRLAFLGLAFSVAVAAGLILLGPVVLPLWAGADFINAAPPGFVMNRLALAAFSLYFGTHVWRHLSQTLALGAAPVNCVAKVIFAESAFILCAASFILTSTGNIALIYLAMAVGMMCFSGWLFPRIFLRGLKSENMHEPDAPDSVSIPV